MNLSQPVTIQQPPFTRRDGEVRTFRPFTLSALDVTIIDNSLRKHCMARIMPFPAMLTLWEGAAYDAAGDYTQAQVEARVLEVLGSDVKAGLEALFVRPQPVR
jgi:hypothetical protein